MFSDEGKKYQDILDCALNIPVRSCITKFSGKMMMMSKLADLFSGIGMLTDVLNIAKEEYDINIDSHVNYYDWMLDDEYWKKVEANIDEIVELYKSEGEDRFDLPSMMEKHFPIPDVDGYAKYKGADKELVTMQAYEEKKNKENYRSVLSVFYDKRNMPIEELQKELKASVYELRKIMGAISEELNPSRLDTKKCVKLFDTLYYDLVPEDDDFEAFNDFYTYYVGWKEDSYGELQKDDYTSFIENEVALLLRSGFFIIDNSHDNPRKRKEYEKGIDYEMLEVELDKDEFYKRYFTLRTIMNYNDGIYSVKDKANTGKYIWKNRHNISRESIMAFYKFICMNQYVARDLEVAPKDEEECAEGLQSLEFYQTNDKSVFTHCNLYVVGKIKKLVDNYYTERKWATLGNIEYTLSKWLRKADNHTEFVKQLIAWELLRLDESDITNAAAGIVKRTTKITSGKIKDNETISLENMKRILE